MPFTLAVLFWGSVSFIGYVYVGYPGLLLAARMAVRCRAQAGALPVPRLSVVIAARNEEAVITRRLANILAQDFPVSEILVGCDGSTDGTARACRALGDERIKVIEFPGRRGRALVHNDCVAMSRGDILVFTDAATEFRPGFLREIAAPFADPRVGVATGTLLWREAGGERAGWYWASELWLRRLESGLGLLATATGACMAVRREVFVPLLPDEDVDFTTPLQAVRQGLQVVHVATAVAVDDPPTGPGEEFRARSRMVTKNLAGTLRELWKASPLRHPGLWWTALSHKVLRWLTPFFVLLIPLAAAGPATAGIRGWVLLAYATGAGAAAAGALAGRAGARLPLAAAAWSLTVVNAGMLAGVVRVLAGQRISSYEASSRPAAPAR